MSIAPEQVQLIKATVAKGATNDELKLFLNVCQKTGLDPFTRQIYCIERYSFENGVSKRNMVTQISIDGQRVVAERSGKYQGQLGPFWCGDDGVWQDSWLSDKYPAAAKVGVLKEGFKEPLWAVAHFKEYVCTKKDGNPTKMWEEKSALMIAKVAEALALRKAFPQDLSGLYTSEEMPEEAIETTAKKPEAATAPQQQLPNASASKPIQTISTTSSGPSTISLPAGVTIDTAKVSGTTKPSPGPTEFKQEQKPGCITKDQLDLFWKHVRSLGLTDDYIRKYLRDSFDITYSRDIPASEFNDVMTYLSGIGKSTSAEDDGLGPL